MERNLEVTGERDERHAALLQPVGPQLSRRGATQDGSAELTRQVNGERVEIVRSGAEAQGELRVGLVRERLQLGDGDGRVLLRSCGRSSSQCEFGGNGRSGGIGFHQGSPRASDAFGLLIRPSFPARLRRF
jgi:hypothetical protein